MNDTLNLYGQLRNAGYRASEALRAARIVKRFQETESDGLVRLVAEPEHSCYFDVYGEPEGYVNVHGKRVSAKAERAELEAQIERDGCWLCGAQYWDGETWRMADSVGMCVYNRPLDPRDNSYVPDLMNAALNALTMLETMPATMI